MTYVIGEPCVDVLDRACVEECPVDCIYEGERMLYIHPDECVDCGACEPVCPWRRSTTRMTCRRSGRATPARTCGSSPSPCLAAASRSALRAAPPTWAPWASTRHSSPGFPAAVEPPPGALRQRGEAPVRRRASGPALSVCPDVMRPWSGLATHILFLLVDLM